MKRFLSIMSNLQSHYRVKIDFHCDDDDLPYSYLIHTKLALGLQSWPGLVFYLTFTNVSDNVWNG